jgi:hypothetical protein
MYNGKLRLILHTFSNIFNMYIALQRSFFNYYRLNTIGIDI